MDREQVVQMARARARQSHDQDGSFDRPLEGLGMPRDRRLDEQPIREQPHDLPARREATHETEIRLGLEGRQEDAQPLAEVVGSEVREPARALARLREERRLVEGYTPPRLLGRHVVHRAHGLGQDGVREVVDMDVGRSGHREEDSRLRAIAARAARRPRSRVVRHDDEGDVL